MKTFLKWAGISLALLVAGKVAWNAVVNSAQNALFAPEDYTRTVETGGPIEAKYMAMGSYEVEKLEVPAPEEDWGKFVAYYPAGLAESSGQYPVVVMVNGTGVGASKYPAVFEHLASWGFIVVGNDDPSTCTGDSADATLAWLLNENADPNSRFYQKVDQANIGVCGHSQGGVGVFNAVNANPRSGMYRCAVSLSPTDIELAAALHMDYDPSPTKLPVLVLAASDGDVIQLDGLQKLYSGMDAPRAMARRTGVGHGQMLYTADGYVTAWFMWLLQGDETAARAFTGDAPELLSNPLYQDQQADLGG